MDAQDIEKLHELIIHNDLPFLPDIIKIEKVEKLVANLHDKTEYVIPIRNLTPALTHGLVLKRSSYSNQILSKCSAKTIY